MTNPTAGWYSDPTDPLGQRLWDGESWTQQTRPVPPTGAAAIQATEDRKTPSVAAPRAAIPTRAPVTPTKKVRDRGTYSVILFFVVLFVIGGYIGLKVVNSFYPAATAHVGIGSTVSQMTTAHGADHGSTCQGTNTCFGDAVNNSESSSTYQFSPTTTGQGLVLWYQQNFPDYTTATSAVAKVMRFLPADAVASPIMISHNGGSCGVFNITSPTLAKLFASVGETMKGVPAGTLGVVMEYVNSDLNAVYDPNNVQDASITPTPVTANQPC